MKIVLSISLLFANRTVGTNMCMPPVTIVQEPFLFLLMHNKNRCGARLALGQVVSPRWRSRVDFSTKRTSGCGRDHLFQFLLHFNFPILRKWFQRAWLNQLRHVWLNSGSKLNQAEQVPMGPNLAQRVLKAWAKLGNLLWTIVSTSTVLKPPECPESAHCYLVLNGWCHRTWSASKSLMQAIRETAAHSIRESEIRKGILNLCETMWNPKKQSYDSRNDIVDAPNAHLSPWSNGMMACRLLLLFLQPKNRKEDCIRS